MTIAKFGIGQPVHMVEDHRFITGQGRYTDDHVPDGCLHALVLRSPHAHARFQIPDLAKARALPGVQLVLIAPDVAHLGDVPCQAPVPNDGGSQGHLAHIPVLARDTVRHVGDAIAFVVADDVAAARDGVEAIAVDYEVLPAIVDLRGAIRDGAPAVWSEAPNNVAFDSSLGDKAAVEEAFAQAPRSAAIAIENNP